MSYTVHYSYTCDGCGKLGGSTNAPRPAGWFSFHAQVTPPLKTGVSITVLDLCGDCAAEFRNRYLPND